MSKTVDKLSEAEFFLKQIEANYFQHPAFDYFLGAFISSARSVLWVMRSEFNDIEGWESWYESLEPSTNDKALLQKINTARIRAEKQAPIQTNLQVEVTVVKEHITEKLQQELESLIGKTVEVSVTPLNEQSDLLDSSSNTDVLSFVGKIEDVYRVLSELGDNDVLIVCKDYYEAVKGVVLECESRFG